ncbi:AraC family transcriptional regulator [Acinetobacter ursingii]|uniref:AraC family transcriptional regulator n=1 Tax=Acinetobacter ursingii TaxID=108980 RepID=UPI0024493C77|nr:AraC family transcriptional regulator [Acinetobacter ursingii]MDG9861786.1 AraC family transcriptional regulator [Acinetobacter ursingii]MDG9895451.1 AraC family transcriptional regulator [Acinetobacter ursingii]MDH0008702.1 AraC family transcriptional regulator [Acinetobacter ursingii]MDH0480737.1 AraC family transcriptional regulator [Acinetobacter ursingii]MDH2121275.1 AraC family transcriptional regulator [Acinetobacter ursingii]
MSQLKNYTGSVYGGLGHLLKAYCEAKGLEIPGQLQQFQNLERFDYVIWRDLLEDLNRLHPRTGLGLEIAAYVQPKHLGIIAYLALSCENLGEAMARYQDFHRLIYDGSPLLVEFDHPYVSIRWEAPEPNPTQLTDEIAIALMIQFLKLFMSGEGINLHEVHFLNSAPKNISVYEQYFQCRVRFDQPRTQLILPVAEAFKPLRNGDHTLQQLLLQQAQALLDKLPNSTQLDQRLQHAISTGLQKNQYQIDFIAKKLGVSVRQLQRHLQQQNATFQERVQEVRFMLATEYLKDPHLSLQEIALLLCYSEQSAFQRAFKHWTQVTPQQWRIQHFH